MNLHIYTCFASWNTQSITLNQVFWKFFKVIFTFLLFLFWSIFYHELKHRLSVWGTFILSCSKFSSCTNRVQSTHHYIWPYDKWTSWYIFSEAFSFIIYILSTQRSYMERHVSVKNIKIKILRIYWNVGNFTFNSLIQGANNLPKNYIRH